GYNYVVCPWIAETYRDDAEKYQDLAIRFNEIGHLLEDHDLKFGYHNHSFEFDKLDHGHRGMDILFEQTGSRMVFSELDVYWVKHGGDDPLEWMDRLKGRVPLLHIKDMADTPERGFAEVGTGTI